MLACAPLAVCFVAPAAYPILARQLHIQTVGGAEVQQVILARELARRGHRVSMLCMDYGQADGIQIDGVTVYRSHKPDEGLPVLRFLHPRLTSVWAALRRANAQVYYQRAASALTGQVVAYARLHQRAAVFASASDMDFVPGLPWIALARDRALFRWGARRADAIVVQTDRQVADCQRSFQRKPVRVASCYAPTGQAGDPGGPVLWVGTVKPLKQPHLFVALARSLPGRRFQLIGGGSPGDMAALKAQAADVPNLQVVGFVPYAEIEPWFDGASVIVNTSTSEGFPNTFLQAWSRGIPSLSFFDPGVSHLGQAVGLVAADPQALASQLAGLLSSAGAWRRASELARACFDTHHTVTGAADAYEALFAGLVPDCADAPRRKAQQT